MHTAELTQAAATLNDAPPQDIIAWALARHPKRTALACSFGGPTGMVALDMTMELDRSVPVYFLDTGLLFRETYELVERVSGRYGIEPIAVRPAQTVAEQAATHGDTLWHRMPDACCDLRKVQPQRAFLRGFDAWISGLRRDQSATRAATPVVQWDDRFGLVKVNPFAHWDERMIWTYIRVHEVPYNDLHDAGYPSAGCRTCTRAVAAGEHLRAGRWPGLTKTECGIHAG